MKAVVGVDGGKSGLRLRIVADTVVEAEGPGFSYESDAKDVDNLVGSIRQAFAECGTQVEISRACVGLTGVPNDPRLRRELRERLECIFGASVLLTEDSLTAHAGALGEPGTVISVGTGTVARALSPEGSWARVDGWGAVLGDRGSAHALGLSGLRAAVRGFEGVGDSTALTEAMFEMLGGRTFSEVQNFYRFGIAFDNIASFAERVGEAADEGDAVAQNLCREAVAELLLTVRRAAQLVGLPPEAPVAATGRLMLGPVGRLFSEAMAEIGFTVRPSRGTSLDGAVALAQGDLPAYRRALVEQEDHL